MAILPQPQCKEWKIQFRNDQFNIDAIIWLTPCAVDWQRSDPTPPFYNGNAFETTVFHQSRLNLGERRQEGRKYKVDWWRCLLTNWIRIDTRVTNKRASKRISSTESMSNTDQKDILHFLSQRLIPFPLTKTGKRENPTPLNSSFVNRKRQSIEKYQVKKGGEERNVINKNSPSFTYSHKSTLVKSISPHFFLPFARRYLQNLTFIFFSFEA